MSTISLTPGQLGARLRSDANGAPKAVHRAMFSAGQRGKALLVKDSPVDRGILRNAWKVVKLSDGVDIVNDQPYAGIVELGAKPFRMSQEGFEALVKWVERKLISGQMHSKHLPSPKQYKNQHGTWGARRKKTSALQKEAESIAWAISRKFARLGMKGKRFVYNNLNKLAELMDAEVTRYLGNFFNRGAQE